MFTLIGLPGVGKTTVLRKCADVLTKHGIDCEIQSTDEIIQNRFKQTDPVILQFEKKIGKIPEKIFSSEKPIAAFINHFGEEPLFRDLEEMFIQDIIQSSNRKCWFDLGGKAPLRENTINLLKSQQIVPIFLYAEHATILKRLSNQNEWTKRSNYLNAGLHWKDLAKKHRDERLAKYITSAAIIISVDVIPNVVNIYNNVNPISKTTEQIAREILYRIRELELACIERENIFTNQNRTFFSKPKSANKPSNMAQTWSQLRFKG